MQETTLYEVGKFFPVFLLSSKYCRKLCIVEVDMILDEDRGGTSVMLKKLLINIRLSGWVLFFHRNLVMEVCLVSFMSV